MGFLSKVSNAIFGSSNGPKYNQDKSALTSQYGVNSAIGNMSLQKNADGTYSKVYDQTQGDVVRNNLINQGLGNVSLDTYTPTTSDYSFGSVLSDPTTSYKAQTISDPTTSYKASSITDPTQGYSTQKISDPSSGYSTTQLYGNINQGTADNAAQSYYDQATRLLNQNFDREKKSLDTNLINRGIQVGSDQYEQAMGDLQDRQNATLNDLANQSIFQGQNLLGTMLTNQARQTSNEGSEIGNRNALLQNQNQLLQNQYQQTANEGAEIGNKNTLLQNQAQYLQNQGLNTTNEGLVFDNQGKLINNQAGLLANQGRQLSNEGSYYSNLGQILANQGQQVTNEGNALANQTRNLSNESMGLSNANQYYANQAQQIANINALGAGRDVYGVAGLGGNNQAYENAYNAAQYNYQNQANKNQQLLNAGIGAAAMMLSDKRLKENLHKVGALDNGLNVYVGNYKPETGLDTRPQLFLLAQEVKKKHPEAVASDKLGMLAVDYKQAVKEKK